MSRWAGRLEKQPKPESANPTLSRLRLLCSVSERFQSFLGLRHDSCGQTSAGFGKLVYHVKHWCIAENCTKPTAASSNYFWTKQTGQAVEGKRMVSAVTCPAHHIPTVACCRSSVT